MSRYGPLVLGVLAIAAALACMAWAVAAFWAECRTGHSGLFCALVLNR